MRKDTCWLKQVVITVIKKTRKFSIDCPLGYKVCICWKQFSAVNSVQYISTSVSVEKEFSSITSIYN